MGMSFTTAHIYNAQNLTKAQFKKAFTDMMKEKGYASCDEEDASVTYSLVFSPDLKWVTALTDRTDISREAADFALELRTKCVVIDLVDSDFAELSLFDEGGAHKDTLTLGDSYLEDAAPMGDPAAWQPLLCGSWEQVQEIQNGSYTFAEDSLAQFAPLIGMDSGDILLDNDSVDDDNAVVLHFKKAAEKKLTLNSAFVKVFGEALEPLGFVKVKSKHPYFVRLVGNEFINIVTLKKEWSPRDDEGRFTIYAGIATVYRYSFDFELDMSWNKEWLRALFEIYTHEAKKNNEYDDEFTESIVDFSYLKGDNDSLIDSLGYAYELTEEFVLPVFDRIHDIKDCIRFFKEYSLRISTLCYIKNMDFENSTHYDEGMLYVLTDDTEIKATMRNNLEKIADKDSVKYHEISDRLSFFDDPDIHDKALLELKRRKEHNLLLLGQKDI